MPSSSATSSVKPLSSWKPQNYSTTAFHTGTNWFASISGQQCTGEVVRGRGISRSTAIDDVQVKEVKVVITDEQDTVIEQGAASNGGEWWTYVATAPANGRAKVLASATDLPGHVAQMTKEK